MVRVTSREVESDAMGRVTRETVSLQGDDVTPEEMRDFINETAEGMRAPDARAELRHLIDNVSEWLAGEGWPDPRRYRVLYDNNGWQYLPDPLPPPPIRGMLAVRYIVKNAGELSQAGFAAKIFEEATATLAAYESGDLDRLYDRTHSLAVLRERMTARYAFFRDVERGRKTIKGAREGGRAKAEAKGADTELRLERMAELVPRFGISGAAHILAGEGLGAVEANRKLWSRRPK